MPRKHPQPFWRAERTCYYVQIGKKQHRLDPDRDEAFRLYHELIVSGTWTGRRRGGWIGMHPDLKLPPGRSPVDRRPTSDPAFAASAPAYGLMCPSADAPRRRRRASLSR
jgi:hypothetical protein